MVFLLVLFVLGGCNGGILEKDVCVFLWVDWVVLMMLLSVFLIEV